MIISIDCETRGLDATQFVAGCIYTGRKHYMFYDKKELYDFIIRLGLVQENNKKVLNVYAHNHQFDFYAYADIIDKGLKIYNISNPFIVSWKNKKECIKFLDTKAIFPMTLEELGNMLGYKKGVLHNDFKDGTTKTKNELQLYIKNNKEGMMEYLKRDTEIPILAINYLKDLLKSDGVELKRLYTINQIAMGVAMNFLYKDKNLTESNFWYDREKRKIRFPMYQYHIHNAYRGGIVRAMKKGVFYRDITNEKAREFEQKGINVYKENLSYIDINSLYPDCARKMRMPNLYTDRLISTPLDRDYTLNYILSKIGVSRVLIKTGEEGDILPIRTDVGNYFPEKNKYIIGTYTHQELLYAIECGYKIIDIEWSVIYDEMQGHYNPLKSYMEHYYKKRMKSTGFENYYYKQIMNRAIGKFAQNRPHSEIVIDTVEKADEYFQKQYDAIKGVGTDYVYRKIIDDIPKKPYYCPIIPTLINADARIRILKETKKINKEDRVYNDTDSIIYVHRPKYERKFDIGRSMGLFKRVKSDVPGIIYARKTYSIGNKIVMAGVNTKDITKEDFEQGKISYKKMVTLGSTQVIENVGKFNKIDRDVHNMYTNSKLIEKRFQKENIYIDNDINNINRFIKSLSAVLK